MTSPEPQLPAVEGPFWPEASPASGVPAADTLEALAPEPPSATDAASSDPAASSGAWPEPPTPWADTGAIAAVAAATSESTEAPSETPAPETAATPDVSDLPTAVNALPAETPPLEVEATAPPAPEAPPAYSPPPPDDTHPAAPEYATPAQLPVASGYVAPLEPAAAAYVASPARPRDTTPVIVEAILAFFGFYGIGWLIAGETTPGIILLIAGFVWDAIFVAAAVTVIGLCCVVPLQLIFVALSAFQLNNRLRMRA